MLDPAIQEMQRKWKESGVPDLYSNADGPESRRRGIYVRDNFYPKPVLESAPIEHDSIPGPAGEIPIRIVRPKDRLPRATTVYFHGGGWIVGDLDSHEAHAIRIADLSDTVVVNVDYRLAPEHPFPAAVEDAIAATEWVHANLGRFGGHAAKFAVGGDSAGGNLAAVTAIHCRDKGIPLAAQLLIYPATDLSKDPNAEVMQKYLGPVFRRVALDPRASPALTPSLAGLAPAILGVGIYDFLYQDNLAYAKRLREADVPLVYREFQTLNHGFFSYVTISKDSLAAANELCADLRRLLHG